MQPGTKQGRRVGIVADDLTGAADTGVQFAKRGLPARLVCAPSLPGESGGRRLSAESACSPVLALNTRSRNSGAGQAARATRAAAIRLRDREILFKKIDSTLRGNVGAEIDAAMAASARPRAVLTAAYPEQGRVTADGTHYVDGVPLAFSEAARDPLAPVRESQVCAIVGLQSRHRVGSSGRAGAYGGARRLAEVLEQQFRSGVRILAADAVDSADLRALAQAALSLQPQPLLCGTAGLAGAVAELLAAEQAGLRAVEPHPWPEAAAEPAGGVLVVCGSASETSRRQVDFLLGRGGAVLFAFSPGEVPADAPGSEAWVERAAVRVARLMRPGAVTVVGLQPDGPAPAGLASGLLGRLTARLLEEGGCPLKGLVLTGGDTAEAVLGQLAIREMQLLEEVLPGVPLSRPCQGRWRGLAVLTKAGAFGSEDTLWRCGEYLRRGENGESRQ